MNWLRMYCERTVKKQEKFNNRHTPIQLFCFRVWWLVRNLLVGSATLEISKGHWLVWGLMGVGVAAGLFSLFCSVFECIEVYLVEGGKGNNVDGRNE